MKNPDLNALAPGGWCRCSTFDKTYGCLLSCEDAPDLLIYEQQRPTPNEKTGVQYGSYYFPPQLYKFWDCWHGNAKIYFERIGGYGISDCNDFSMGYHYAARYHNGQTTVTIGRIQLICTMIEDSEGRYRYQMRLLLLWHAMLRNFGSNDTCSYYCNPGQVLYHGAACESLLDLACPPELDKPPSFVLWEGPQRDTPLDAMYTRPPCLSDCLTVLSYVRKATLIESEEEVEVNFYDTITPASLESVSNPQAENGALVQKLTDMVSYPGWCHCSEPLSSYFLQNRCGDADDFHSPKSVSFSFAGFPSAFAIDIMMSGSSGDRHKIWKSYDFSPFNGTHVAYPDCATECDEVYFCTIQYTATQMHYCNGEPYSRSYPHPENHGTVTELTATFHIQLQRCLGAGLTSVPAVERNYFYPSCRRIKLTWGDDELHHAVWFFGDDEDACGADSYYDAAYLGYSDQKKCSEIVGDTAFSANRTGWMANCINSVTATIVSLNN